MPRRYATKPGTVSRLCACGTRITLSQVACISCWKRVPRSLQIAWLAAKDGDCDSGPALERARSAIEQFVRKEARSA